MGGIFPIQALLGLMAVTALESVGVVAVFGLPTGLWSLMNLLAIQFGYLAGIYIRSLLEKAGLAQPGTRVHHTLYRGCVREAVPTAGRHASLQDRLDRSL